MTQPTQQQPAPAAEQDYLMPCPFCGGVNVNVQPLVGGFVVDCHDCGGGCGTCHSEVAAREEWNRRISLKDSLKQRGLDSDKVAAAIEARFAAPSQPVGAVAVGKSATGANALRPEVSGIESEVCRDIAERQKKGIAKYGTSVADNPLSHAQWLRHAYEEALDFAIYLKAALATEEGVDVDALTGTADDFHPLVRNRK